MVESQLRRTGYVFQTKNGAYSGMVKANLERMGVTSNMVGSSLSFTDLFPIVDVLEAYPNAYKLPFFNLIKKEGEEKPACVMVPWNPTTAKNSPM
jgi:hypothetical protein